MRLNMMLFVALISALLFIPLLGQEGDHSAQCRAGGAHGCHCLRMVAEVQDRAYKACERESDYEACAKKVPTHCDIIADPQHSGNRDRCATYCRRDLCFCSDSMPCAAEERPE